MPVSDLSAIEPPSDDAISNVTDEFDAVFGESTVSAGTVYSVSSLMVAEKKDVEETDDVRVGALKTGVVTIVIDAELDATPSEITTIRSSPVSLFSAVVYSRVATTILIDEMSCADMVTMEDK
jgi:UDP-N-acetyl-D-mannosaminuronate dehydrogenase